MYKDAYKGRIASSCPPHAWTYLEGGGMQCCNCLVKAGSIGTSNGEYDNER
jgi:hypothetical protein